MKISLTLYLNNELRMNNSPLISTPFAGAFFVFNKDKTTALIQSRSANYKSKPPSSNERIKKGGRYMCIPSPSL